MHEEKLIWKKERNGIYSVQSGYNLVMRDILSNASSCVEVPRTGTSLVELRWCYEAYGRHIRIKFGITRRAQCSRSVCRLETWKAWHDANQPHDSGVSAEWHVDRNNSAGQNQPGLIHQPIGLNVILTPLYEDIGTLSTSCCFRNKRGQFVMAQTQWRVIRMSFREGVILFFLHILYVSNTLMPPT
ncbi:hypothetical protein QL285_076303 [Trifolium repens]|nr:hypothetical protein QL285_076303 [Trifolium repens]